VPHRIVFHRAAIAELAELHNFIAETSGARRADSFVGAIRDYCLGFEIFPERGLLRNDISKGLRVVGFRRRVSIAFRVDGERVMILGIYYGGRDFGPVPVDED
jgi:toxin ParE1/3/4